MTEVETQMATSESEETKMEAVNGDGTDGSNGTAPTEAAAIAETPAETTTEDTTTTTTTAAGGDAEERKLFCGGLSLDTTETDLKAYFEKFGPVEQCTVKMNPMTNKSRCFGFVTFTTKQALDDAMAATPHTLKGKQIDPKPAKARPGANKVFCGGLPPDTSEETIRTHFGQFGTIEALELPMDKEKNVRRGFIFVTFETVAAAEAAAKKSKQTINGKECDVKKATPRTTNDNFRGGWSAFGMRGARGGRGGFMTGRGAGRGGYGAGQPAWGGYGAGYGGGYDASYGGYGAGYDGGYGAGWGAQGGYGGGAQWQQGGSYGKQGRGGRNAYHPYR